jgi:hypothetical protein
MKKILVVLVIPLIVMPLVAKADLGPKPSMDFDFKFETSNPITITGGQQIVCQQSDCRDGRALGEYGPQGFTCNAGSCNSMAYGYDGDYHQLVIQFSDGKTRTSNIFFSNAFDASFTVTVTDGLVVGDSMSILKKGIIPGWILALVTTLVIELLTAMLIAYVLVKRLKPVAKKSLLVVLVMNCISLPAMWFVLSKVGGGIITLTFAEIIVFVLEMFALYAFLKPVINFKSAFGISFFLNAMSFFVGGALLYLVLLPRNVSYVFAF